MHPRSATVLLIAGITALTPAARGQALGDPPMAKHGPERDPALRPKSAPGLDGAVHLAPNAIVIELRPDAARVVEASPELGLGISGIGSLDDLVGDLGVQSLEPLFPGAHRIAKERNLPDISGWYRVRFDPAKSTIENALARYAADAVVLKVEPVGIHAVDVNANDAGFPDQWHLSQPGDHDIDAPQAWDGWTGSPNTIVAVLDTGVRYFHKDLGGSAASFANPAATNGNVWINLAEKNGASGVDDDNNGYVDDWVGWDFVGNIIGCWAGEDCAGADNDPRDFNGHGTHCAGIVAAISNNGYALASPAGGWGIGAPQPAANGVKVMCLRIGYSYPWLGQEGGFVGMDYAASAFYYAANNGAKIASCSWSSSNTGGINAAINYFLASGGLIFKAAGNAANENADAMCARTDIYSVAATDQSDLKAGFSSYGTWVDISAPGAGIVSLFHSHNDPGADYVATLSGTSMATPLVASVAASVWSKHPSWNKAQVWETVRAAADPIDLLNPQYAGKLGSGRLNLDKAIDTAPCDVGTLAAEDGHTSDQFGNAVAIDGDVLVVGAHAGDGSVADSGTAYVFKQTASGWEQAAKLQVAGGFASDLFGFSVAIDDDVVVVGAHLDDAAGSAWVFKRPPAGWSGTLTEVAKLISSDRVNGDAFGYRVAIRGDTIIATAVLHDGAAGANSGAAYVFKKPPGGWSGTILESAKLVPSDNAAADEFGASLAMEGDIVAIGAPGDDRGEYLSHGSAYVFKKPSSGWAGVVGHSAKLRSSVDSGNNLMGQGIAMDGDTIVAVAPNWSRAFVFVKPPNGWVGTLYEQATLKASGIWTQIQERVAIRNDIVAVWFQYPTPTTVALYQAPIGGWSGEQTETLVLAPNDPTPGTGDDFGSALAFEGPLLVVGARSADGNAYASGAVRLFDLEGCGLTAIGGGVDCNQNGEVDVLEIGLGHAFDCNGNSVPDDCDLAAGASADVNRNTVPDECECSVVDIDCNGAVDGGDLGVLLGSWGPCQGGGPGACPADLDGDGVVGGSDLGLLLGAWG